MRSFAADTGRDVAALLEDLDIRINDWRRRRQWRLDRDSVATVQPSHRDWGRAGFPFPFGLCADDTTVAADVDVGAVYGGVGDEEGVEGLGECVSDDWAGARWWFGGALMGQPPVTDDAPTVSSDMSSSSNSVDTDGDGFSAPDAAMKRGADGSAAEAAEATAALPPLAAPPGRSLPHPADLEGPSTAQLEEEAAVLRALQRGVAVLQVRTCLGPSVCPYKAASQSPCLSYRYAPV